MTISRSQMNRQLYYGGGEGIASLDAGAPSIKYEGDIKPQMASAPDPMADLYDQFLNMKKQGVIPADMDFDSFKDLIREQAAYGGSMRQQYGLGSIVKKAVKGVTKAVKSVASSDLGKAALTGAALYYGGGGNLFGLQRAGMSGFSMANLPGYTTLFGSAATGPTAFGSPSARTTGILSKLIPSSFAGKAGLGITALGGLTGYLASQGMDEQQIEEVKSRPEALKTYLRQYYVNLNPELKNQPEKVEAFVNSQLGEYAYAVGGRVGYSEGSPDDEEMQEAKELAEREGISLNKALGKMLEKRFSKDRSPITRIKRAVGGEGIASLTEDAPPMDKGFASKEPKIKKQEMAGPDWYIKRIEALMYEYDMDYDTAAEIAFDSDKYFELMPDGLAKGGRPGYAMGNTAQMAAGIEGLPFRQNQAGVGEVDLRETGGFIPPVGVKEKADDIPAMLSNNEFVFTADAVRGMGDGNVNVGAQRMYDMMKKLEKGGRV